MAEFDLDDYDAIMVPMKRIEKDIKKASSSLTDREARYLVGTYYNMQAYRIRAQSQIRAMDQAQKRQPHATLDWFMAQAETLEKSIRAALGEFAKSKAVGLWSQGIMGIGPVISAGLIAHIGSNIWVCMATAEVKAKRRSPKNRCTEFKPCSKACHKERVNTVSRIWRYAGLDPTVKWGKGQLRPWNANLKVLCWKAGQSFVKVSSNKQDFYGQFYKIRKQLEVERNDKGMFADQAKKILEEKNIGKDTDAYQWYAGCYPDNTLRQWLMLDTNEQRAAFLKERWREPGTFAQRLPPGHIQARAERYAVKIFLSHWHQVAYYSEFRELPPRPYVLDVLGHKDQIQVPDWPF